MELALPPRSPPSWPQGRGELPGPRTNTASASLGANGNQSFTCRGRVARHGTSTSRRLSDAASIVVALLVFAPQARAEPSESGIAFAELRGAWMHPVYGYAGVGEALSTGARLGFFPSISVPVAMIAGFDVSCAEHLSCWKSGEIGARYTRTVTPRITLVVDGLGGLQTVGLHVSKELYGYAAIADVGLTSRFGALEVGAQAGVTYSSIPSYDPDLGPSPSGIMATAGLTAAVRW